MFDGPIVVYDAKLKHTSAWANTYLDRDHFGRSQGEPAAAPAESKPADPPRSQQAKQ